MLTLAGCSSSPTAPTSPQPGVPPPTGPAALAIVCPSNAAASSANNNPVAVTYTAPVVSGGIAPVQVTCAPSSGTLFPLGTTTVQCTAADAAQTSRTCQFSVTVSGPVPRLARTKFLAFGDSMTAGEITAPTGARGEHQALVVVPASSYPTRLLGLLRGRYTAQTAAIEVLNAGRPGEWAEDGALRLPGVMSSNRPEAVLLLSGSNELGALGTAGVQRAWRAIDLMAKEVRGRGARAFLATLPPARGTGTNAIPLSLIQALNANIRSTARGEGAVLVDLYEALSTDPNRYIGSDGLHPTEAGYQRIAETFFAAIRQEYETRP